MTLLVLIGFVLLLLIAVAVSSVDNQMRDRAWKQIASAKREQWELKRELDNRERELDNGESIFKHSVRAGLVDSQETRILDKLVDGGAYALSEISSAALAPPSFTVQILHRLREDGVVDVVRSEEGGDRYQLRDPRREEDT